MTRTLVPLLATGLLVTAASIGCVAAQQPPAAAPEPKMPPMPSMEGQQGDVSKPTTQIPPRKKPGTEVKQAAPEKKAPAKAMRPTLQHKRR